MVVGTPDVAAAGLLPEQQIGACSTELPEVGPASREARTDGDPARPRGGLLQTSPLRTSCRRLAQSCPLNRRTSWATAVEAQWGALQLLYAGRKAHEV